ncbi:Adenylate kinase 2 [Elasticomyces elasticus]|nr:Adenylate kinase 2 [Elasticomyces elasticus]
MQLRKAARIILVGAPGVGKGTQTERMLKRFPQLSSISSGDLLRIQAESLMKTGALIPDTTILRLILSELTNRGWLSSPDSAQRLTLSSMTASLDSFTAPPSHDDGFITMPPREDARYEYSNDPDASFILDGFPRTAAQATQLDRLIPINLVVDIKTPTSIILDRICNRWVHPRSGRVYNTTFNAPKVSGRDDVTGEELVQRDDDRPEVWEARLKKFDETSLPLLEHYERKGVLWSVGGNSSDEISPKLFEEFGRRFGNT